MLIVAGKFTFDPTKTEIAKEAAAKVMAATHEEPANLEYVFSFDAADPATMRVFELWESEADLDAHLLLPHVADFRAAMGEIGVSAADVMKYDVASSRPM